MEVKPRLKHRASDLIRLLLGERLARVVRSRFAQGAAGTFGLKVISTGLSFIVGLVLARALGASNYGAYAYAMAWVGLLAVPAALGLDRLLIRETAVYQSQEAWSLMRGLLIWANKTVLIVSVCVALLAVTIAWLLPSSSNKQMLLAFYIAMLLVPLVALTRLRSATMIGLRCVIAGQIPEALAQPIIFIALLIFAFLLSEQQLSATGAVWLYIVSFGLTFTLGAWLLHQRLPKSVRNQHTNADYRVKAWLASGIPLLFHTGMHMVSSKTDMLMLGTMQGAEATGIYAVANRGAGLVTFVLMSVNMALAPVIASLYATGKIKELQNIITKSARVIFAFSFPVVLVIIVFRVKLLGLFGQEFTQGEFALIFLTIAQAINAIAGTGALLLIMTGYEKENAVCVGLSTAVNVLLNFLLIPRWGIEGAAVATGSSLILLNVLLVVFAYKRLGIHATVLGNIKTWTG